MTAWHDMTPSERNELVGEIIGAEHLTQCYVAIDDKRVLVTPYTEAQRGKVDAMLVALRASDDLWNEFKQSHSEARDEWRQKLTVSVERWHIRYSDTPGGAWNVVEWLQSKDRSVDIAADAPKSEPVRVTVRDFLGENAVQTKAPTFAEAVCRALIQITRPELLE